MSRRTTFQGRPMTFHESLHLCGCESCCTEIADRFRSEPPLRADFSAYLRASYPKTAHLISEDRPDA